MDVAVGEIVDWLDGKVPFTSDAQEAVDTLETIVAFHASHRRGAAWTASHRLQGGSAPGAQPTRKGQPDVRKNHQPCTEKRSTTPVTMPAATASPYWDTGSPETRTAPSLPPSPKA